MVYRQDTIVALATPPGVGAIGVIRLSGDEALNIIGRIFQNPRGKTVAAMETYTALHGYIHDSEKTLIDEVVILFMKGPHSFTGEDLVEISAHGGPLPLTRILKLLLDAGARLAEPGEFSKRAFLNGKIDLAQAEAIFDVIMAKTETGLNLAMEQLEGSLSSFVNEKRNRLIEFLAFLEASIDFPEDELPGPPLEERLLLVESLKGEIEEALRLSRQGQIYREGLLTTIVGRPNVGKSSLLNAIAGKERALVTEIPGTTRDFLEEVINLQGIPLCLTDTAGLRETKDLVEKLGVEKTRERLMLSDLILVVLDITEGITDKDLEIIKEIPPFKRIIVINKTDITEEISLTPLLGLTEPADIVLISAREKKGLEKISTAILRKVTGTELTGGDGIMVTNIRHEKALRDALHCLENILALGENLPLDLLTIDVRGAINHLGEITGQTIGLDIYQKIFSEFCLGK